MASDSPEPSRELPKISGEPQKLRGGPQILPRRPPGHTQLRNRRFAALRELLREGEYFSEEQMRLRSPALFHHYIGRFQNPQNSPKIPQNYPKNPQNYPKNLLGDPENPQIHPKNSQNYPKNSQNCPKNLLGDPEIPQNSPKNPKNSPKNPQNYPKIPQNYPKNLLGDPEIPPNPKISKISPEIAEICPQMAPGAQMLRELLLSSVGDAAPEEEEEDEDEDEEEEIPDEAERELLRLEFTTRMFQSFLEGQDGDFDYRQVDENPELDNLDILSRDLEEKYFDEEEPSEAPELE